MGDTGASADSSSSPDAPRLVLKLDCHLEGATSWRLRATQDWKSASRDLVYELIGRNVYAKTDDHHCFGRGPDRSATWPGECTVTLTASSRDVDALLRAAGLLCYYLRSEMVERLTGNYRVQDLRRELGHVLTPGVTTYDCSCPSSPRHCPRPRT